MNESVKIIHSVAAGSTYRFLADFFRLAGIFVGSCTAAQGNIEDGYTLIIRIQDKTGNDEHPENVTTEEDSRIRAVPAFSLMRMIDENDKDYTDRCKNYLYECISDYVKQVKIIKPNTSDRDEIALEMIADIYVDHELMRYRSIYTYFFEYKEQTLEAHNHFAEAYKALWEVMKPVSLSDTSKYLIYAQLNLAKSINETCKFLDAEFIFNTRKCLDKADRILEMDPQFHNVYILKAFLTELDLKYIYRSEGYYRIGLESAGQHPYMAYPRYRMGRYYERILEIPEKARENYERALTIDSNEYRAIYKLIQIQKSEKKFWDAIESCKKICNILREQNEKRCLQPREYEYLYKAYAEMAHIYESDLRDSTEYAKAVRQRDDICDMLDLGGNRIYREVFEEKADELARLTSRRLRTRVQNCIG